MIIVLLEYFSFTFYVFDTYIFDSEIQDYLGEGAWVGVIYITINCNGSTAKIPSSMESLCGCPQEIIGHTIINFIKSLIYLYL